MSKKTRERVKATGEVFTPRELIHQMLQKIPSNAWLPGKRWLEPSAGDGNFLYEVKHQLVVQAGIDEKYVLDEMLFAIEFLPDNHFILQQRLGYLDENGMPNREIWKTDEDVKRWFHIRKMDDEAFKLAHRNPYYEFGFVQDSRFVICHNNMICASALVYDMGFGRHDEEAPVYRDRSRTLESGCLRWEYSGKEKMLTPCKGEETNVDKFLQSINFVQNSQHIEKMLSLFAVKKKRELMEF